MNTVKSGRKRDKKQKSAAPAAGAVCAVICSVSLILFCIGEPSVPVSTVSSPENSFWESFAEFAAHIFLP